MIDRPRRLRKTAAIRKLVRETELRPHNLVMPYFVRPGKNQKRPIKSMPGQFQWSVDRVAKEAKAAEKAGVGGVILFGIPAKKDARGTGAWAKNGIIQKATRAIKDAAPELPVITDLCLCEYTDHGHCGLVTPEGEINNDATLPLLARTAVSQVEAGADIVAPSGMMDGAVGVIREAVDETPILSYAAKYASAFYGPFRDAAESPPKFGDRTTHQMDPANHDEAMKEIALDLSEGADIIMVKPALPYLDVIRSAKERFGCPTAAYQVSGEYSMIRAAVERGWMEERRVVLEVLTSIRRAGADFVISYFAREATEWIS